MGASTSISIAACIPLYNGEAFIARALESVFKQTRPVEEIVIVDDGSKDNGVEIVRAMAHGDKRVIVIRKENGGQAAARNLAVKECRSDHVAFLDQDDWWYPNHIEALEEAVKQYRGPTQLGWTYSDLDEYDLEGKLVTRQLLRRFSTEHPKMSIFSCLAQDMYVLPSASLISRVAFDSVGGFDERLSGYEDDDLFIRLFRAGYGNVFLTEALSGWRIHSGSSTHTIRMVQSAHIYARKLIDGFPDDIKLRRRPARDLIGPRFLHSARQHYRTALKTRNFELINPSLELLDCVLPVTRWRTRLFLRPLRLIMRIRIACLVLAFKHRPRPDC